MANNEQKDPRNNPQPEDEKQQEKPGEQAPGQSDASEDWEEVEEKEKADLPAEYSHESSQDVDKAAMAAIPTGWSARVRFGFIVLVVTFIGFGGWAFFAPLDGAAIADGKVFFDFEFTPPYPAEHIIFRSALVIDYLAEIV